MRAMPFEIQKVDSAVSIRSVMTHDLAVSVTLLGQALDYIQNSIFTDLPVSRRWIFWQIHLRLRKYFGVWITGLGEMFDDKKIEISKISWDPPFNRTLRITVKIFGWYIMPYLRNCQIRSLIVTSSLECRKGSADTWQKERKREKTRLRPLHSQCEN